MGAFGYSMPKSVGELDALCSHPHSSAVEESKSLSQLMASSVALAATSGNACHSGKVALLHHFAPKCFVPCEASCPAVGLAVDAYFKHGQGAAEDSVCQNKAAWRCFVEPAHIGACTPLITKAAAFGYSMPKAAG